MSSFFFWHKTNISLSDHECIIYLSTHLSSQELTPGGNRRVSCRVPWAAKERANKRGRMPLGTVGAVFRNRSRRSTLSMDEYVSRLEVALFSATGSLAAARGRDVAIVERERAHAARDAGEGVKLEVSSRRLSRSRSRASSLSRDSTPPRRTHSGGRHSEREKNGTAKLLQLESIPHSPRPSATCQESGPTSVVCNAPLAKTLPRTPSAGLPETALHAHLVMRWLDVLNNCKGDC